MIENDTQILEHLITEWTKELPEWIDALKDKIISRQMFEYRKVGAEIGVDQVTTFDRTGHGASIVAKGSPPLGSGSKATNLPHELFQLLDGININEKDIKHDPKLKPRNLKILLANLHHAENKLALNGNAEHNIPGLVSMAQANPNGVIAAGDITGDWDGSDTSRDIYNDVLLGLGKFGSRYDAEFMIANKIDSRWLYAKDSEGVPYWKSLCALFNKDPTDKISDWLITCDTTQLVQGKVYLVDKDEKAAEIVVSENPTMRAISLQPGGNYPIEMYEWLTIESHDNSAFVEIAITGHP